ncbi:MULTISPECIES: hypothetical protein [Halorussus]|uniref:hypothetical protein n=1 Tax=Halorussus TaxID=1070314 RepID=UPI000E216F34|nr:MULTISPECIES: hypothetical protein [Halorussus]NHN60811.1 hypothetical protein [Halorussus sp. JP-T4]
MVDDRESPSAGWREVYREMDAATDVEEPTARCLDCGRPCEHVAREVYDCEEHGLFRASGAGGRSADDGDERVADGVTDDRAAGDGRESSDSDDAEEIDRRARGTAD